MSHTRTTIYDVVNLTYDAYMRQSIGSSLVCAMGRRLSGARQLHEPIQALFIQTKTYFGKQFESKHKRVNVWKTYFKMSKMLVILFRKKVNIIPADDLVQTMQDMGLLFSRMKYFLRRIDVNKWYERKKCVFPQNKYSTAKAKTNTVRTIHSKTKQIFQTSIISNVPYEYVTPTA